MNTNVTSLSGVDWAIDVVPTATGLDFIFTMAKGGPDGMPLTVSLGLTREEGRRFARGVLAAAGDAMERTFPQPHLRGRQDG